MTQAQADASVRGRIANVSAVLVVDARSVADATRIEEAARLLTRLFEDVLVIGGDATGARAVARKGDEGGVNDLVTALEAAREERVLVLDASEERATAALLLGLTAWPEHVCVAPRIDGVLQPLCAIYLREEVLREASGGCVEDLHAFVEGLDCGVLEGADVDPLLEASWTLS
ncbi:MAG: hypothetical protein GY733_25330 [bacterium]|nr:hypothetical protein [bacterium]